jgi:hypothetical protein
MNESREAEEAPGSSYIGYQLPLTTVRGLDRGLGGIHSTLLLATAEF